MQRQHELMEYSDYLVRWAMLLIGLMFVYTTIMMGIATNWVAPGIVFGILFLIFIPPLVWSKIVEHQQKYFK